MHIIISSHKVCSLTCYYDIIGIVCNTFSSSLSNFKIVSVDIIKYAILIITALALDIIWCISYNFIYKWCVVVREIVVRVAHFKWISKETLLLCDLP